MIVGLGHLDAGSAPRSEVRCGSDLDINVNQVPIAMNPAIGLTNAWKKAKITAAGVKNGDMVTIRKTRNGAAVTTNTGSALA